MSFRGGFVPRFLRLRSSAELRDRGRQRLSTWLERFSTSPDVREASDAAFASVLIPEIRGDPVRLLQSLRTTPRPSAFFAFDEPSRAADSVRARFPDAVSKLVARARRAVVDRFDIFGHEGLSYGDPIDWLLDPLRGRRAPRVHWSRVPYLDVERVGDHKVTWELNRHQHLITLAQAYWLTGDLSFVDTVVRHLGEWMEANPPKVGINWSSSLELAFRAISWTWAIHLLRSVPTLPPKIVMRAMKYLHIHAQHITSHLSTYFSPNTHLTGEALGLLYLGTFFPEFRDAKKWRELGWSILERQVDLQTSPDGIYFEQTTWYQRYTADFYLHAVRLRQASGEAVTPGVLQRLDRLIDPLVYFMRPDGTTPLIGDDDGGQLAPLFIAEANDFRPTLALAGAMLERTDCATLAESATAVLPWIISEQEDTAFRALHRAAPRARSKVFPAGGYFVTRSRWAPDADYLLIDCGPHGALSCGHSHADALSFELTLNGVNLVLDPGTYSYAAPDRDAFRTTSAHNTLTVDQLPSSIPGGPFNWKTSAVGRILDAGSSGRFAFFKGSHDGFRGLPDPATHSREIFGVYHSIFVVRDYLEANASHRLDGRYHLAADIVPWITPDGTTRLSQRGATQPIADLRIISRDLSVRVESGRIAPIYGIAVEAPVIAFSTTGKGDQEVLSFFIPRLSESSEAQLRELTTQVGRVFALSHESCEELIGIGEAGVRNDTVSSDARWLWVRFGREGTGVVEFVLLQGSSLRVDTRTVYTSAERRSFVTGSLGDNGWQLDVGPLI